MTSNVSIMLARIVGELLAKRIDPDGAWVYLLHFATSYHHAQHYLGSSRRLMRRILAHVTGRGSPLLAAVIDAGIEVTVARTWAGGRAVERALKRRKNHRDLCPICRRLAATTEHRVGEDGDSATVEANERGGANARLASAAALVAALPTVRLRLVRDGDTQSIYRVESPDDVGPLLVERIGGSDREELVAVLLNAWNGIIGVHTVAVGHVNCCDVAMRDIFKAAVVGNAVSILLAHNHPSGNLAASPEDLAITRAAARAGKLLGINLLDHLIVSQAGYVSLRRQHPELTTLLAEQAT